MAGLSIQELLDRISGGTDRANEANEQRYGEIKGLFEGGRNVANNQLNATGEMFKKRHLNIRELLQDSGRGAKRDARRRSGERMAASKGDLANRGFGTSAILNASIRNAEGRNLGSEMEDIDERVSTQRAGAEMQTMGDLANFMFGRTQLQQDLLGRQAGFMERRTDTPGQGDLNQLLSLLGQGGGAAGGGGGFRGHGGYGLGRTISRRWV